MESYLPSVTCTVPGSAHKARNCTNELCVLRGLCQGTTTVKQTVPFVEPLDVARHAVAEALAARTDREIMAMLPTDKQARKDLPIGTGVLDYFPAALAEVARTSKAGNDQHNPGQELHWARGKSMDHFDAMVRHLIERGTIDTDGIRHTAKAAWRILALLQEEMEAAGAPMSRASKVVE